VAGGRALIRHEGLDGPDQSAVPWRWGDKMSRGVRRTREEEVQIARCARIPNNANPKQRCQAVTEAIYADR
jgi:hypothetical protein